MTRSLPRITAGIILAASGALIAITSFALVAAKVVIATRPDLPVRAADVALLQDIVPLTPFMTAFAVVSAVVGLALLTGRAWADRIATAIATVATTLGAAAFILVAVGHDPFSAHSAIGSAVDGLAIIGSFTAMYVAVVVALAFASAPDGEPAPQAHALPAAA